MKNVKASSLLRRTLPNSRFWILTSGIVVSVNIAGFVQLLVPAGSLQAIRIEQIYGFIALALLYLALLASPLTTVFPRLPGKAAYLHARRPIGVLTFYYAFLHGCISFFSQLDGFAGLKYLDPRYQWSLALGIGALGVLLLMAATSLDWAVDTMGFKNWKLLHRLVYLAGLAVLVHVVLIGPHYEGFGFVSGLTYLAVAVLLCLQAKRIQIKRRARERGGQ